MKKFSSLFAILFFGIVFCCLPCTSVNAGIYGRTWIGKVKLYGKVKEYDIHFQPGYAIGVAVGYSFFDCCRLEIEGIQLFDKFKDVKHKLKKTGLKGKMRDYTFLANFILECPMIYCVKPYAGIGWGRSYEQLRIPKNEFLDKKDRKKQSSYQFIGGLSIPLYNLLIYDMSLFFEGRYFALDRQIKGMILNGGLLINF